MGVGFQDHVCKDQTTSSWMEEESTEEETGGLFTVEHVENEDIAMPLF